MYFKYVYDKTLAQASYVIGCQDKGIAAIIDPKRDDSPDDGKRMMRFIFSISLTVKCRTLFPENWYGLTTFHFKSAL